MEALLSFVSIHSETYISRWIFSVTSLQHAKAGLAPATQIRVSGCFGMALAHSHGTSCDSFGGQCRYNPSPNILKYSLTIPDNFLFFVAAFQA